MFTGQFPILPDKKILSLSFFALLDAEIGLEISPLKMA
jgi:hypothetical protein